MIQIDTSKIALLAFDKRDNYPFDSTFSPVNLTQDDISTIDSLLVVCVTDYNNHIGSAYKGLDIDIKKYNYRKQLIAATNKNGEKEVWVNCFCYTWNNENWKTTLVSVDDGGKCYFNFKINLVAKRYYNFKVNGYA